jgi:hypothetical protein
MHLATPKSRQFWLRPAIFRHDPGLAASPRVRYKLRVGRSRYAPFLFDRRWTNVSSSPPGGDAKLATTRMADAAIRAVSQLKP